MRFPMDRPVKVVMLGAGGTGGYVAPYLFRLLHMLDRPARFIICDGDLVEAKNLDRQNFVEADLGENKARVLSERYSAVLGMETEYVPNFIETLPELMTLIEPGEWETDGYPRRKVREMVLLLGCVDNNRTRQLCHEAFKKSLDLIYIDSGNGSYTGQVVCGVRKNGRTVRKPRGKQHEKSDSRCPGLCGRHEQGQQGLEEESAPHSGGDRGLHSAWAVYADSDRP